MYSFFNYQPLDLSPRKDEEEHKWQWVLGQITGQEGMTLKASETRPGEGLRIPRLHHPPGGKIPWRWMWS